VGSGRSALELLSSALSELLGIYLIAHFLVGRDKHQVGLIPPKAPVDSVFVRRRFESDFGESIFQGFEVFGCPFGIGSYLQMYENVHKLILCILWESIYLVAGDPIPGSSLEPEEGPIPLFILMPSHNITKLQYINKNMARPIDSISILIYTL